MKAINCDCCVKHYYCYFKTRRARERETLKSYGRLLFSKVNLRDMAFIFWHHLHQIFYLQWWLLRTSIARYHYKKMHNTQVYTTYLTSFEANQLRFYIEIVELRANKMYVKCFILKMLCNDLVEVCKR